LGVTDARTKLLGDHLGIVAADPKRYDRAHVAPCGIGSQPAEMPALPQTSVQVLEPNAHRKGRYAMKAALITLSILALGTPGWFASAPFWMRYRLA
jgi:hypothetical protein